MVMNRMVLTELERLETVDYHLFGRPAILHPLLMKEHAVSSEPGYVAVDSLGADFQIPCNLSVCHAADGLHDDL